jgi:hypothetical protein
MFIPFLTKKATRDNLDALAKRMPVLSEAQQKWYVGRNGFDCWWRCIAYINSNGTSYTEQDAHNLASGFWGSDFDSNSYGFSGTHADYTVYVAGNVSGNNASGSQILIFDANQASGWEGISGASHAVIIKGTGFDAKKGAYHDVYCPQSETSGQVFHSDLSGSANFIVRI